MVKGPNSGPLNKTLNKVNKRKIFYFLNHSLTLYANIRSMENKLKLKKLKTLTRDLLKSQGKKLPANTTLEDVKILAGIITGKFDLDLDLALANIKARKDKACISASRVIE